MAFTLVITDAGRAALVNAQHSGTNAVQIATVGVSATAIAPSTATAALPGEVKRLATISGTAVAANVVHLTVRDETADTYTLRSFALYLADGTLFATYGQVATILEKTSGAVMLLALDVTLADINAAQIQFGSTNFIDPPSTTDTAGVVELATDAETVAGADQQRAVTPHGLWAAMVAKLASWGADVWRASNDGSGSGLDADLLDGLDSTAFAKLASPNSFTSVQYAPGFVASRDGGGLVSRGQVGGEGGQIVLGYAGNSLTTGEGASTWNIDVDLANAFRIFGSRVNGTSYYPLSIAEGGLVNFTQPPTVNGAVTWNSGNDGSGSGLDADLLDGYDSSWFADIVARLGFTPLNRAADTVQGAFAVLGSTALKAVTATSAAIVGALTRAGNTVWDAGNDGAGSGLDADLLDGLDSSAFARLGSWNVFSQQQVAPGFVSSRDNGGFVSRGIEGGEGGQFVLGYPGNWGITEAGPYTWNIDVDANSRFRIFAQRGDGSGNYAITIPEYGPVSFVTAPTVSGALTWNSGNDGSGSGLDADMLDGYNSSDFFGPFGSNANGYWEKRLKSDGTTVIDQWGTITGNWGEGDIQINFPIPFTDAGSVVVSPTAVNSDDSQLYDMWFQRVSKTVNNAVLRAQFPSAGGQATINGVDWRAIGR